MKLKTRVKFTRKTGQTVRGIVKTRAEKKANGEWIGVMVDGETKVSMVPARQG